nr:hypothetical protein Iba_chr03aCG6590 [Ipomoea batatas]
MKVVAVVEQVRALVAWRDGGVWPPVVGGGCDVSSSCCDKWWLRRSEDGLELGPVMAVRQHGGALQRCWIRQLDSECMTGDWKFSRVARGWRKKTPRLFLVASRKEEKPTITADFTATTALSTAGDILSSPASDLALPLPMPSMKKKMEGAKVASRHHQKDMQSPATSLSGVKKQNEDDELFASVADASTAPIYTRAESLLPPLQSSTMLPHRHHRTQLQAVLKPPQPPLVAATTADVTAATDYRRPDPAISPRH